MSTKNLKKSENELENFMDWTPKDVAAFLKKADLGDYSECFIKHNVSGSLLHLLKDEDLKDMGIKIVGDRLRLKAFIDILGRKNRSNKRTKVWWEGTERLYLSCADKACSTCCFLCPDDPSTYKLTSNHLKVKTVNPMRCGPFKFCCSCCTEYKINNVDLSEIDDVDLIVEAAPCCCATFCCAKGRAVVAISTRSNDVGLRLILTKDVAEKASNMILQNIEECQVMERD